MGLFAPKPSKLDIQQAKELLKKAQESAKLVNNTVDPKVFFGRLNFLLDVLLELSKYEKYKILKGTSPSCQYQKILDNLNATVDDFIDRSYAKTLSKVENLKTEKAKQNNLEKYAISMLCAFELANTFWVGNCMYPHYSGPLYTDENLIKIKKIAESIDIDLVEHPSLP